MKHITKHYQMNLASTARYVPSSEIFGDRESGRSLS